MAVKIQDVAAGLPDGGFEGLTWRAVDMTLDASYAAGGYALVASDFNMSRIIQVMATNPSGYVVEWDPGNSKLKVWRTASHTHTENTAAAYTQNATTGSSGAGAMSEVPNNLAALNGIVVRVLVIGVA